MYCGGREGKWKGKKKKREKNMRMARAVERGEGWEENEGLIDR